MRKGWEWGEVSEGGGECAKICKAWVCSSQKHGATIEELPSEKKTNCGLSILLFIFQPLINHSKAYFSNKKYPVIYQLPINFSTALACNSIVKIKYSTPTHTNFQPLISNRLKSYALRFGFKKK